MPDPCWPPALFLLVHSVAASSRSLPFLESARLILTHAFAPTLSPAGSSSFRSLLQEALPDQLGKCSQSTFSHKYNFTLTVMII